MKYSWFPWGISILIIVIQAGYAGTLAHFCSLQMWASKKKKIATAALIFLGRVITNGCYELWNPPYIIHSFIYNILFLGLILLLFSGTWEKKLLIAVIMIIIEKLAGSFSVSFLSCLVLLLCRLSGGNPDCFFESWFINLLGALGLGAVIGATCCLSEYFRQIFLHKPKKWFLVLAVPLVFMSAVIDVVNWGASNGIVVVSGVIGAEYGRIGSNAFFSNLAICLISLLLMCMAAGYIFGMDRLYTEQRSKEQYRSQVDFYKMLEEQYRQMERLRHDMKNHLISLQGLWDNQEWEKMGDYLENMMEAGSIDTNEEATGSKAVDALLYSKRKRAEKDCVAWECEVQVSGNCGIEEFDICVLLGNILDNALEACERLSGDTYKYIHIRLCTIKRYLLLEVKNSADMKNPDEIRHTRKEQPEEHGMGILNIRETAEKYNGAVNTEVGNGEFVISVLLPFGDTVYDGKVTL